MQTRRGFQDRQSHSWVITDHSGGILEASAAGAALLNVSQLHLRQRSLVVFFDGDRPEWQRLLEKAARGEMVERSGWIRPRDRRRRAVHVALVEAQDYAVARAVRWQFNPADRA
jgi:PAS domain-containing protein